MWSLSDKSLSQGMPDIDFQSPRSAMEECPSCHAKVQPGRFCASCGARLNGSILPLSEDRKNGILPSTLVSKDEGNSKMKAVNPSLGFLKENMKPELPESGTSVLKGFEGRRFSLDVSEEEYMMNNGEQSVDLSTRSSLLSPSSSLPHSSTIYPGRRRASTSTALAFTQGLVSAADGDLSQNEYAYDPNVFETSAEPIYGHIGRTGSVPLDPLDGYGMAHGLHAAEAEHAAPSFRNYAYNTPLGATILPFGGNDGAPEEGLLSSPSFKKGRSFSDVEIPGPQEGNETSYRSSLNMGEPTFGSGLMGREFGNNVDPSFHALHKHNSLTISHPSSLSSALDDPFAYPDSSLPISHLFPNTVVKGSVSFPSRPSTYHPLGSPLSSSDMAASTVHAPPIGPEPTESVEPTRNRRSNYVVGQVLKGHVLDSADVKKFTEFNGYRGRIVDLVCNQNGSKSLQTFLNNAMCEEVRSVIVEDIISEITSTGCKIICDTFGNYFYQLLFKKASDSEKETLLLSMLFPESMKEKGSTIYEISVNKTGTFAFQNIIDYMKNHNKLGEMISRALEESNVNESKENVTLRLIKENKGTHIIQRIMKTFDIAVWENVYKILLSNCFNIAMDRNGSMVLRLCYDLVDIQRKEAIAKDIIEHSNELATDPVGNYVVQHILTVPEKAREEDLPTYHAYIRSVLSRLSGHYIELSKQKYSSNVVEKSISNSVLLGDRKIFEELLAVSSIIQLLDNHFGTYVLQKVLQSISKEELKDVDYDVRNSRTALNHGGNLVNKWKQIMNRANQCLS